MMKAFLLGALFGLSACGSVNGICQTPASKGLSAFFAKQQECNNFIYGLSNNSLNKMSGLTTVQEMRSWLRRNSDDSFSQIVLKVQEETKRFGILNPENKNNQIRVTSSLYHVLQSDPRKGAQSCDVDVGEIMAERMYFGVHGADAPIFRYLEKKGVFEPSAQRRTFLTALMAGKLSSGW